MEFNFNYAGMKTSQDLSEEGLNIKAKSEDGSFNVVSYIGRRKKKGRVYGRYDYIKGCYVEERIR